MKECEQFFQRARAHLVDIDNRRALVVSNISGAEKRLEDLKKQLEEAPPLPQKVQRRYADCSSQLRSWKPSSRVSQSNLE